jgi:hypothetical protein
LWILHDTLASAISYTPIFNFSHNQSNENIFFSHSIIVKDISDITQQTPTSDNKESVEDKDQHSSTKKIELPWDKSRRRNVIMYSLVLLPSFPADVALSIHRWFFFLFNWDWSKGGLTMTRQRRKIGKWQKNTK